MADATMSRVFGGSPLAVFGRLILVSILVGVILSALGLDPFDIVRSIERLICSRSGTWASMPCAGCGAISCSAR